MSMFAREDVIWAAGFLEGEGSFSTRLLKTGTWVAITQAAQHQRSKDCLEKIQAIFGGRINGPYNFKSGKPGAEHMLMWGAYKKDLVYAIGVAVYPFMGERRKEQIEKQIEAYKTRVGRIYSGNHN